MRRVQIGARVPFEEKRRDVGINDQGAHQSSSLSWPPSLRDSLRNARKSSMLSSSGQKVAFARAASTSNGPIPCSSASCSKVLGGLRRSTSNCWSDFGIRFAGSIILYSVGLVIV